MPKSEGMSLSPDDEISGDIATPLEENVSENADVLEIRHLQKTYHNQAVNFFEKGTTIEALDDVSFTIRQGEIFGLVGESGCGKSTLGRAILGLVPDVRGEIFVDGHKVSGIKNLSKKVQIVFQDSLSALNSRKKIGWILEEPLKIHKLGDKATRIKRVNEVLNWIGLDESFRERYPRELSGGQRQRISIGCALMLNPKLIVADEPVSALDVSVQAKILNLLLDLHHQLNLAYLFISHNLNVVYYLCDRVAVMHSGRIVELAPVDQVYDHPLHPYTRVLLDAIPKVGVEPLKPVSIGGEASDLVKTFRGCAFYPRCPKAAEICRMNSPELLPVSSQGDRWVRCHGTRK